MEFRHTFQTERHKHTSTQPPDRFMNGGQEHGTKMKRFLFIAAAALLSHQAFGVIATSTKYTGTFVGNGAGITNLAASAMTGAQPASANLTNWSAITPASKQGTNSALTKLSLNDGSSLTNIAVTSTNADYATTAGTATNWTGAGTKADSTNSSIVNSLAVTGVSGDGVRLAVRRTAAQTNDIFQIQNESNVKLFGITSNGIAEGSGARLTNLVYAPIVVAGSGCTVTPTTNAGTGQITFTITVP